MKSFTLIELLIVVALITTLAAASLALLDPLRQVKKTQDTRKMQDLALISRVMEDYYNDKNKYPPASDICYDAPQVNGSICSCHTCSINKKSSELAPYFNDTLCDPQHPAQNYLYQYDCNETTLSWYRMCASLDTRDIASPSPFSGAISSYNYGVGSSNTDLTGCIVNISTIQTTPAAPTFTPGPATPTPQSPTLTPTPNPTSGPTATPTSQPPTPTPGSPTSGPTPTPVPTQFMCPADPASKYCYRNSLPNNCGTFASCNSPGSCDTPIQLYADPGLTQPCF